MCSVVNYSTGAGKLSRRFILLEQSTRPTMPSLDDWELPQRSPELAFCACTYVFYKTYFKNLFICINTSEYYVSV